MHFRRLFITLQGFFGGSTRICFRTLFFLNIFNDLCNVIKDSQYLIFADYVKVICAMNSFDDCFLLQSDIGHTQGWCSVNFMKLNNSNAVVILSLGIQMFFNYICKLMDSPVIHMCTIKDLGV
jgi:hypothetical protein